MSEPTPLSVALTELIARKGLARVQGSSQLASVWSKVAGERISSVTRVLGFQRGVLEVGVVNSAMLNELVAFHRSELLQKLQLEYPQHNVRDVRFRLRSDLKSNK